MPEIQHNKLPSYLKREKAVPPPETVFLVYGEGFLVEQAADVIIDALLPDPDEKDALLETVDMADGESIYEIIERINTRSFFGAGKILRLKGDILFSSKTAQEKDAEINSSDAIKILKDAIEKGFPKGHTLLITTGSVDRRSALYKAIAKDQLAVNCAVPTGSRKADVDQQKQVLRQLMQSLLARHEKTADADVFERVFRLTGFAPRVFLGDMEKLVHFSGASPRIRNEDVAAVLDKSRDDPVFAFTNAVFEKNVQKALYYLSSLFTSGFHYMQLLAAMTSQARRLLMVKFFTESPQGNAWSPGMGFDRFKNHVMPAAADYDKELAAVEAHWKDTGGEDSKDDSGDKKKKKTGKTKVAGDLAIVKNPGNAYPVYQLFLQSDQFSSAMLKKIMINLHEADLVLKTSGRPPKSVLEELIFHICISEGRPLK